MKLDMVREHVISGINTKNRNTIDLVLRAKHFACQKYVVWKKTDFKTDRLELSITLNRAC